MTAERFKTMVPIYAATDYRPPQPQHPKRVSLSDWFRDFKKRNGIALLLILAWTLSMFIGCGVTGVVVRHNTTERVTAEVTSSLRNDFQAYLDNQLLEEQRNAFLSGDASFEAAVDEIAVPMSQVIATYAMDYNVPTEGLYTIGWVYCARLAQHSAEFGKTAQEILEKAQAWEGSVVGHAVRNQDLELAREVARDYLNGKYPDGFTTAMTFFTRESSGKIIARNEFLTGPYTTYWWLGK